MKKRKIAKAAVAVLSLMAIGASGAALAACGKKHEHSYGDWVITQDPTLTAAGKAERNCVENDNTDSISLPALNDTSVWTENTSVAVPATHMADGSRTFTSEYGTVTITVPKGSHVYGTWEITKDPTMTETGKAKHKCDADSYEQEIDIPALSDTVTWTEKSEDRKAATCTTEGEAVYVSTYGTVTVTMPIDDNAHAFGAWTFVGGTKPTLDAGAQITSKCEHNEQHTETVPVPALTDSFWTKDVKTAPTHQTAGVADFKNATYGLEVNGVALPKEAHTFGAWEFVDGVEPTQNSGATIKRVCTEAECEEDPTATETHTVANLLDTTEWTAGEPVTADYNHPASITYTHKTYEGLTVTFVTAPKLVAPYDNKTYHSLTFEISTSVSDGTTYVKKETAWKGASLVVDENSKGTGTGFPFKGTVAFELLDTETGYVKMTITDTNSTSDVYAYVDMQTGVIVMPYNGWDSVHLAIPSDSPLVEEGSSETQANLYFKATTGSGMMAISYTNGSFTNYTVFVTPAGAYLGVTLEDINGGALTAENCFDTAYGNIFVKKGGNTVVSFGHNGEDWVAADEFVGKYTIEGGGTAVVNGAGYITVTGATNVSDGGGAYNMTGDNEISAVIDGTYCVFTLSGDGMSGSATCTVAIPQVTITLNFNGKIPTGESDMTKVLSNISTNIPYDISDDYEHSDFVFRGWFEDENCLTTRVDVDGMYTPTKSITLYAKWATKVEVNIIDEVGGNTTLYLGEGDVVRGYLSYERYQIEGDVYFDGWYVGDGSSFDVPVGDSDTLPATAITLFAHWVEVPSYIGSYAIYDVYGLSYTSSAKKFEIKVPNEIIGDITGNVLSFNKTTKEIVCQSGATTFMLYFDEDSGLMMGAYSNLLTSTFDPNEFYAGGKNAVSSDLKHYAVKANSTSNNARFVVYKGNTVLVFKNGSTTQIYADITIKNGLGEALTVDNIKDTKTLVVRNATTQQIIFAVASTGASIGAQSNTTNLDAYFGVYEWADHDGLTVDGAGSIKMGSKTGTYTIANVGSQYTLDVYLSNETEYWRVTLDTDGKTYTAVKPVVTITFNAGEYASNPDTDTNANINVVYDLPVPVNAEGIAIFRGWYFDSELDEAVPASWRPDENEEGYTLYAKWDVKATVTFNYLDNGAHANLTLSDVYLNDVLGEKLPVVDFKYGELVFLGWFTDDGSSSGEWGEEVTAETVISETTLEYYAQWIVLPIYAQKYNILCVNGTSSSAVGSKDQRDFITFDLRGYAPKGNYPFSRTETKIHDYNEEEGTVIVTTEITNGESNKNHKAFIDKTTGIMVINYAGGDADFARLFILLPISTTGELTEYKESYWNSGKTRVISFMLSSTPHTIFVHNNVVYFDVKFETAEGASVEANAAYQSETLYVRKADNEIIVKFGYIDGVMGALDGFEDITYQYSSGDEDLGTVTVNGSATITVNGGTTGSYSILNKESGLIGAYVNGGYYEITLDKDGQTYTIVKPMVNVNYVTAHDSENAQSGSFNKNIAITLPTLTAEGYVFLGWYEGSNESKLMAGGSEYTPTADVDLTAKWAAAFKVTLVYNNGLGEEEVPVQENTTYTLPAPNPIYSNGKHFAGWYMSDNFEGTPVTSINVTGPVSVYAKWEDGAYVVTSTVGNYGFDYVGEPGSGYYESNNKGRDSSNAIMTVTVYAPGKITFKYQTAGEKSWDYLTINYNGKSVSTKEIDNTSNTTGVPEGDKWLIFELDLDESAFADGPVVIEIKFQKDSSGNKGSDCGWVKDIEFVPANDD